MWQRAAVPAVEEESAKGAHSKRKRVHGKGRRRMGRRRCVLDLNSKLGPKVKITKTSFPHIFNPAVPIQSYLDPTVEIDSCTKISKGILVISKISKGKMGIPQKFQGQNCPKFFISKVRVK